MKKRTSFEKRVLDHWAAETVAQHLVASMKETKPSLMTWDEISEQERNAWLYAAGRLIKFQIESLISALEGYDITLRNEPTDS